MEKLKVIRSKIFSWEGIARQRSIWKFQDKTVVFTNGCFDILHLGHIEYLSKAADLGKVLIIGLNSDMSVQKLKGFDRPLINEAARAMLLASLSFVTAVVLFDEDTPYKLIELIQPDILVKGADYKVEEISGHDIVLAHGGRIETIELTKGYSTSALINRIRHNKPH
jgi:D-glycero-beta-D-manno-heptose 1-phosphate adenylyltransferase